MSTPKPQYISQPVQNPMVNNVQKPVWSGNAAADAEAKKAKEEAKKTFTSSQKSILTSGMGDLDDTNLKNNKLG